jgi:hypothetical protein
VQNTTRNQLCINSLWHDCNYFPPFGFDKRKKINEARCLDSTLSVTDLEVTTLFAAGLEETSIFGFFRVEVMLGMIGILIKTLDVHVLVALRLCSGLISFLCNCTTSGSISEPRLV